MYLKFTEFLFSLQSEGETLCSPPQHRDLCRGGRGVRAAEQPQHVPSLRRHDRLDLRRPPGSRLLEVVPPLEDPLARGEFEFRILILLPFYRNQRTGSMTLTMRQSRLRRWFLIFDLKQILIYLAADRGRPCKGCHSFCSRTKGEKKKGEHQFVK